jgi:hypothetical protein
MLTQCYAPIFSWIAGPFHSLVLKFIALFLIVEGMEIGLVFLKAYIARRRLPGENAAFNEKYKMDQ